MNEPHRCFSVLNERLGFFFVSHLEKCVFVSTKAAYDRLRFVLRRSVVFLRVNHGTMDVTWHVDRGVWFVRLCGVSSTRRRKRICRTARFDACRAKPARLSKRVFPHFVSIIVGRRTWWGDVGMRNVSGGY